MIPTPKRFWLRCFGWGCAVVRMLFVLCFVGFMGARILGWEVLQSSFFLISFWRELSAPLDPLGFRYSYWGWLGYVIYIFAFVDIYTSKVFWRFIFRTYEVQGGKEVVALHPCHLHKFPKHYLSGRPAAASLYAKRSLACRGRYILFQPQSCGIRNVTIQNA